ncbi:bifunctional diaminohydroxyphosphoribosylaminopyrimidine deaminase/5-amino-6-(5-phosphoribosylamino)uracil reductase RibD [Paenibacillus sp. SC116]|uniref:bifunctional diaminohydroxyphosphoribosylaminopyrimidine deaminase/5-amino-6-(5-phosphoribosylamino)uracil reductase RibD n=1 Tax=Paenibacillus sp. SC116 TaxID=2968986 RepID=UPI00215AE1A7|nr:bifunctional diaminohydroxyphosphoribosylaminopyrimidine deaminase/5-amino-6-(5-phosphoribosylamino)uracil reductase RibD [Paenibacillus sp. SC116]MCR8843018.1 bifunctional diaminohydroxyphosphoribosylaminopyrimidine deaminase/5-amino-6-(5-phosphoribosylamino)uracil reductase RibD [Paenibacillus sp. SC116]
MIPRLDDEFYMQLAIQMAERVIGQTSINPPVGCVIVHGGRVVGMGAHLMRGEGHAEVHALQMAGEHARGATAYVTLEPCSHYGQTPPCCSRLIEAGVKRVVVGCVDPNPQVAGRGLTALRDHGIEVAVSVLQKEAASLITMFAKFILTKMPYVTMKTASTLDGKIATHTGDSQWITNADVRERVHAMRHRHQAIMVGIETVLQDNPSLTTRLSVPALNPIRIIVDSKLRLPLNARLVKDNAVPTWVLTTAQADERTAYSLKEQGVRVIRVNDGPVVDLTLAMKLCAEEEIGSILLEGGGTLNGAMLKAGLIDRVLLMIAPKIVGHPEAPSVFTFEGAASMQDAMQLEDLQVETIGDNVMISGSPLNRRLRELRDTQEVDAACSQV